MTESNDGGLTRDAFLNGDVRAWQPLIGYRAATDPVFLAASIPARSSENVLELGCGVGVASLCLAARVPGLSLTGVELQTDYAALARRNAAENGAPMTVLEADLRALPRDLKERSFDHVIANPPYYAAHGPAAQDAGRDLALREDTPLSDWLDVGLRRLRDGGILSIIHLTERLPSILTALQNRASIIVLPLAARKQRPARRVIVQARKGGRSPFMLLPPLVIHQGDQHPGDGEHFTDPAQAILRDKGSLDLKALARG